MFSVHKLVRINTLALSAALFLGQPVIAKELDPAGLAFFETNIRPLLVEHCYKCHSSKAKTIQAELRVDSSSGLRRGGESGRLMVPGDVNASRIIQAIRYENVEMPPDGPLGPELIAKFERWVSIGAPYPQTGEATAEEPVQMKRDLEESRKFWAFQPLGDAVPPDVADDAFVRTPIDQFILAEQAAMDLTPSPIADPHTLIRRAYFDLTGLPPPPEAVGAFAGSNSADAYRELVDGLLSSREYGEQWARHWLDVARFAESNGYEKDEDRPSAYHYRDFVIRALNRDMPYDQFVRWQLAGDLLAPDNSLARMATGFLVAGVEQVILTEKSFERDRYDKLDDMASTLGTALLGLTVGCARCHDHKYDPITQMDYYRMVAAFGKTVSREVELDNPSDGGGEAGRVKAYIAVDVGPTIDMREKRLFISGSDKDQFILRSDVYFLPRGDVNQKQSVVEQGFLPVLMRHAQQEQYWRESEDGATSTEARVALANWITDAEHGGGNLLARVIVNRIWQHHFGRGIVATASDFGQRGERPSHPDLLEWLARELIHHEWKLKPIHRLIMNSSVFMQSYTENAKNRRIDPDNRYLWRRAPRRLQAEAVRDSVLSVSDQLDATMFGPGSLDSTVPRRSIYLTVKRSELLAILQLLDAPDALQGISQRDTTTVAPQALLMLNNAWVRTAAEQFARRIDPAGSLPLSEVVRDGFLIGLSRPPNTNEQERMVEFVQSQAKGHTGDPASKRFSSVSDFCQLLMCLNEFVYVE